MTTIAILITSAFVACCGYIVTESNADTLLAGYNTMSKTEKEKFDLKGYLGFFLKVYAFSWSIFFYYLFNIIFIF